MVGLTQSVHPPPQLGGGETEKGGVDIMKLVMLAILATVTASCFVTFQGEVDYEKAIESAQKAVQEAIQAYCEQTPSDERCHE